MIPVPSGERVWLATDHCDMRKGYALSVLVQETIKNDMVGISLLSMPAAEGSPTEQRGWREDCAVSRTGHVTAALSTLSKVYLRSLRSETRLRPHDATALQAFRRPHL
jgi:hypothetical protein